MREENYPGEEREKPRPGDRMKLYGTHKLSAYTGVYLGEGDYLFGKKRPRVKVDQIGTITFATGSDT